MEIDWILKIQKTRLLLPLLSAGWILQGPSSPFCCKSTFLSQLIFYQHVCFFALVFRQLLQLTSPIMYFPLHTSHSSPNTTQTLHLALLYTFFTFQSPLTLFLRESRPSLGPCLGWAVHFTIVFQYARNGKQIQLARAKLPSAYWYAQHHHPSQTQRFGKLREADPHLHANMHPANNLYIQSAPLFVSLP
jgi:hypothetical protein